MRFLVGMVRFYVELLRPWTPLDPPEPIEWTDGT